MGCSSFNGPELAHSDVSFPDASECLGGIATQDAQNFEISEVTIVSKLKSQALVLAKGLISLAHEPEQADDNGADQRTSQSEVGVGVTRRRNMIDYDVNDTHGSVSAAAACFAIHSAYISSKSLTYTRSRSPGMRVVSS